MVTHTMKLRLIQTINEPGQDQTKPAQADCVLQSVAQNCQLGQVELVELPFRRIAGIISPKNKPVGGFIYFLSFPPESTS